MSWSVSYGPVDAADIKSTMLDEAKIEDIRSQQHGAPDEAERAYRAGVRALIDFTKASIIGPGPFKGYISGHANLNNEKPTGFSFDSLTVNVELAEPAAPEAEEQPAEA